MKPVRNTPNTQHSLLERTYHQNISEHILCDSHLVSSWSHMNSTQSCGVRRVCACSRGVSVWPLGLHLFWVGVVLALPGLGAGARARGGWQNDERPSGTQGAEPWEWAGTCRSSRAQQNRDKSLKGSDSSAQHCAPETAVSTPNTHTHKYTHQNSNSVNTSSL